ncbi:MAG: hypothetical protein KGY39_07525 [Anaerolineales bacterium]|nr:hypothetical protein [Anaerolineales bacterium]
MGKQLTNREMQVISYIVGGHTNKKISEELGISERTVELETLIFWAGVGYCECTR